MATIEDGRITDVKGANYPVPGFDGRICLMGRSRLEYQYHPAENSGFSGAPESWRQGEDATGNDCTRLHTRAGRKRPRIGFLPEALRGCVGTHPKYRSNLAL